MIASAEMEKSQHAKFVIANSPNCLTILIPQPAKRAKIGRIKRKTRMTTQASIFVHCLR
jgi:hypothetical protein